eukprot:g2564.t1
MESMSPYYVGSKSPSTLPRKNFYFVKFQNFSSDSGVAGRVNSDIDERGGVLKRIRARTANSKHIAGGSGANAGAEHWEVYRNYAPIAAEISDVTCPPNPYSNALVRCTLLVKDIFGEPTTVKSRHIQSKFSSFQARYEGRYDPTSFAPDLNEVGKVYVSFIVPQESGQSTKAVQIAFADYFIGANNGSTVTVSPQAAVEKQSILDIDIRFTGVPLEVLNQGILPQQLLLAGLVRGAGLENKVHAVPKDVYPCPEAERCALADSRPTHDTRTDQSDREESSSRRRRLRDVTDAAEPRSLRYKDPRDPSLPPSVALRFMMYGEYGSVRKFMDVLELTAFRDQHVIGNISEMLSSEHGEVDLHVIEDMQISSVHPIRLDGDYIFTLPRQSVIAEDITSMLYGLGVVLLLCVSTTVTCYVVRRFERAQLEKRRKKAQREWALAHPEWKKKYEFASKGSGWKPPKPPKPAKPGEPVTAEMRLAQIRHLRAMRAYQRANKMMDEYNDAAKLLQNIWRQKLARTILKALVQKRKELWATKFMQRVWRGKKGRKGFVEMRDAVRELNKAALLVQRSAQEHKHEKRNHTRRTKYLIYLRLLLQSRSLIIKLRQKCITNSLQEVDLCQVVDHGAGHLLKLDRPLRLDRLQEGDRVLVEDFRQGGDRLNEDGFYLGRNLVPGWDPLQEQDRLQGRDLLQEQGRLQRQKFPQRLKLLSNKPVKSARHRGVHLEGDRRFEVRLEEGHRHVASLLPGDHHREDQGEGPLEADGLLHPEVGVLPEEVVREEIARVEKERKDAEMELERERQQHEQRIAWQERMMKKDKERLQKEISRQSARAAREMEKLKEELLLQKKRQEDESSAKLEIITVQDAEMKRMRKLMEQQAEEAQKIIESQLTALNETQSQMSKEKEKILLTQKEMQQMKGDFEAEKESHMAMLKESKVKEETSEIDAQKQQTEELDTLKLQFERYKIEEEHKRIERERNAEKKREALANVLLQKQAKLEKELSARHAQLLEANEKAKASRGNPSPEQSDLLHQEMLKREQALLHEMERKMTEVQKEKEEQEKAMRQKLEETAEQQRQAIAEKQKEWDEKREAEVENRKKQLVEMEKQHLEQIAERNKQIELMKEQEKAHKNDFMNREHEFQNIQKAREIELREAQKNTLVELQGKDLELKKKEFAAKEAALQERFQEESKAREEAFLKREEHIQRKAEEDAKQKKKEIIEQSQKRARMATLMSRAKTLAPKPVATKDSAVTAQKLENERMLVQNRKEALDKELLEIEKAKERMEDERNRFESEMQEKLKVLEEQKAEELRVALQKLKDTSNTDSTGNSEIKTLEYMAELEALREQHRKEKESVAQVDQHRLKLEQQKQKKLKSRSDDMERQLTQMKSDMERLKKADKEAKLREAQLQKEKDVELVREREKRMSLHFASTVNAQNTKSALENEIREKLRQKDLEQQKLAQQLREKSLVMERQLEETKQALEKTRLANLEKERLIASNLEAQAERQRALEKGKLASLEKEKRVHSKRLEAETDAERENAAKLQLELDKMKKDMETQAAREKKYRQDSETTMLKEMKKREDAAKKELKKLNDALERKGEEQSIASNLREKPAKISSLGSRFDAALHLGKLNAIADKKRKRVGLREQIMEAKRKRDAAEQERATEEAPPDQSEMMISSNEPALDPEALEKIRIQQGLERSSMEKEEHQQRKHEKAAREKKAAHARAKAARMRKIRQRESRIRRLKMPRVPTEKMHKKVSQIAFWYRHNVQKRRIKSWLAIRLFSATSIAKVYRGYRGRLVGKRLREDREIRLERQRRIEEFERAEKLREEQADKEATARRKKLVEKQKMRKLRKKIKSQIRHREQEKAKKYVMRTMRKTMNQFVNGGVGVFTDGDSDVSESKEKSSDSLTDSVEDVSSSEEKKGFIAPKMSGADAADDSEAMKSQKLKKNKMGTRRSNKTPSKYTVTPASKLRNEPKAAKKKVKTMDVLGKQKGAKSSYILPEKDIDHSYSAAHLRIPASANLIESVHRINTSASDMIRRGDADQARTLLVGAEQMTSNVSPGVFEYEFNNTRSTTLMRLAIVLNRDKDHEGALSYLEEAVLLKRTPAIMNNLCSTLSALGEHERALNWALDAVQSAETLLLL